MEVGLTEAEVRSILDSTVNLGHRVERQGSGAQSFGGYAEVWRGRLKSEGRTGESQLVALKFLRFRAPPAKLVKSIKREVKNWSGLVHPNILRFLGVSTRYSAQFCLVSPWQSNGHAVEYLHRHYTDDTAGHEMVLCLIGGTMAGLVYLHGRKIVHGDLKGNNIVVARDGTALLADFGLSTLMDDLDSETATSFRLGAIRWTAPERLIPEWYDHTPQTARSFRSDIFSLGMTMYELLSGNLLFKGLIDPVVSLKILDKVRPSAIAWRLNERQSHVVVPIMRRCWRDQPLERPTAQDALKMLEVWEDPNMSYAVDCDNACLPCQMKRRYDCNKETPACQYCKSVDRKCDWDGSGSSIAELWPQFGLYNCSEDFRCDLRAGNFLGTGSCGEVFRIELPRYSGSAVVKISKRENMTPLRQLALELREAITWSNLKHPNVASLIGVANTSKDLLCYVSEYMENGNIMSFLTANPNENRIKLLHEIATGVKYLHDEGVIHGNLKGNNVLISAERKALLTDIGLSSVVEDLAVVPGHGTVSARTIHYRWAPPERLCPEEFGISFQESRTTESDVFSMFRTFFEILSSVRPFDDIKTGAQVIDIVLERTPYRYSLEPPRRCGLTQGLWKLMQRGWARRREKRPSAAEVVSLVEDMIPATEE